MRSIAQGRLCSAYSETPRFPLSKFNDVEVFGRMRVRIDLDLKTIHELGRQTVAGFISISSPEGAISPAGIVMKQADLYAAITESIIPGGPATEESHSGKYSNRATAQAEVGQLTGE